MDVNKKTLVSATLVLTVLLAACATQSAPLRDTEWVLVSLNGNALIESREITLSFGEASLDGSGRCNTIFRQRGYDK
jgi:heat shock protein HslJ